ncbi:tetratricopeptide repeat protein [Kutzneria sp. 744]|uniref:tetratricopeptide repeat protein n=1 Tax=Kutzneria sp. (strain 744) TaxID=345341 RepID=UPI0018DDBAD0|nr:tetratricopeptide repeat protein [Kutzneria sp. 744]
MEEKENVTLKQFRLRAGLTQEALAEKSGVSIRTIRGLETGTRSNPRRTSLRQLADALELAPHEREQLAGLGSTETPPSSTRPMPRQLPPPSPGFAGRDAELAELDGAGDSEIRVVVGAGGIGKTWLASHWAHTQAERFPDGQLFVDLQGFTPDPDPLDAATAVRGFLDALGVDASRVPTTLDGQIALYRSLVAGRRMLIILDNAATADQVIPLLPGTPTCAVLATSRKTLTALLLRHGAHHLSLGALGEDDAHALLALRLGEQRVAAEPDAVAQLIALCGRYPLALAIVAGRAQTRPRIPLAEFAAELRESGLDALDDDDPAASVPSVLSWSMRALTTEQRKVFALLGIAPGPDIGLPAATSLTGLPLPRLRKVLRELEESSLIDRQPGDRHSMHDLVRELAIEQADHCLSMEDRDAALRRLAEFYLHTAFAGDRQLSPHRHSISLPPLTDGVVPLALPDDSAVMAWFGAEHACLLAAQRSAVAVGWDDVVWQLAWSVNRFHYRHSYLVDDVAVTELGLAAAERLGDTSALIEMRRLSGLALVRHGQPEVALEHLRLALTLAEGRGKPEELAYVHQMFTYVLGRAGQDRQAYWHAVQALEIYQDLQTPQWEAAALNSVGWYAAKLGDFDRAWEYCQQALTLQRLLHDEDSEAIVLDSLGYIDHHLGRHADAIAHYRQSVALLRGLGDVYQLAGTLEALGHPYHALNRLVDAHAVWGEAIELYQAQHRTEEAERLRRHLHTDEVEVPEAASRRRGQHRSPASRTAPVPDLWASGTHPQRTR